MHQGDAERGNHETFLALRKLPQVSGHTGLVGRVDECLKFLPKVVLQNIRANVVFMEARLGDKFMEQQQKAIVSEQLAYAELQQKCGWIGDWPRQGPNRRLGPI